MVTVINLKRIVDGKELVDIACLSTDTKSTMYCNGSMCAEIDTGKFYMFDGENSSWYELGGTSSGK